MSEVPFEQALSELEQVVRDLEDGRLGLDEALSRYERGVALVKACQARLEAAEQRVVLLTGLGSDGQPATQPFQHEATAIKGRKKDDEGLFGGLRLENGGRKKETKS